jgi:2-oxoglutarate ferredoxin oxidoreductase subunit alpha
MNPAALKANITELTPGGTLLVNSDTFEERNLTKAGYQVNPLEDGSLAAYRVIQVPMTTLTLESTKELGVKPRDAERSKNFFALGLVSWMYTRPVEDTIQWIDAKFASREMVRAANLAAFKAGYNFGETAELFDHAYEVAPAKLAPGRYRNITGNTALAYGLIAAAQQSKLPLAYASYPITPASDILHELASHKNFGVRTLQAEDEIAAVSVAIGASFTGHLGVTATSGPGVDLKSEGIGLAVSLELPLIIVDVQRGGPSTGLPTKTEQSDLMACMYPAHGDVRLPVIAVGTVEEAFFGAIWAFNWAERYQGPVILMTEMSLAERVQNIARPDLSKITVESRQTYQGTNGYHRYHGFEMSPMPIPGQPGSYVANGSEHDEMGDTTHLPERHVQMTERRFKKLELLEDGYYERENTEAPVVVMPWGGSKGPAYEAFQRLQQQEVSLGWYYTMFLHPLPPKLLEELKQKRLVIVPELNYQGQFSSILRSMGVNAQSITQYTGLPFKVRDLVERISEMTQSPHKEMARA